MPSAVPPQLLGWCLLPVVLALLLTPKHEVIVIRSRISRQLVVWVYWSGIFGVVADLSDNQMLVFLDNERREIRLCYAGEFAVPCNKYQIIDRGGMLEVGRYVLDLQ